MRRLRAAGAVILGKLNLHELAYGASSVIGAFGPVRNPWSRDHTAGGSSSGSAVAVATGMCYGTVGTDTGGSIRQPAAFCGITGLKPTYGRVSTRGVMLLSRSYDHVGPMTRSALDAALMLQVMAGPDPDHPAGPNLGVPDYAGALEDTQGLVRRLRVGIPREHFFDGLDPEIADALDGARERLSPARFGGAGGGPSRPHRYDPIPSGDVGAAPGTCLAYARAVRTRDVSASARRWRGRRGRA